MNIDEAIDHYAVEQPPKEDSRPKRRGWAPGNYGNTCLTCEHRFIGDKRATHCAECAYVDWEPKWRHRKGGLYQVRHHSAIIEATMMPAVVYEAQDGTLWVRPQSEFYDGRFTALEEEKAT